MTLRCAILGYAETWRERQTRNRKAPLPRLLQHHRPDHAREGDDEQHREPARRVDGGSALGRLTPPRGHSRTNGECGIMNHSPPARRKGHLKWLYSLARATARRHVHNRGPSAPDPARA